MEEQNQNQQANPTQTKSAEGTTEVTQASEPVALANATTEVSGDGGETFSEANAEAVATDEIVARALGGAPEYKRPKFEDLPPLIQRDLQNCAAGYDKVTADAIVTLGTEFFQTDWLIVENDGS